MFYPAFLVLLGGNFGLPQLLYHRSLEVSLFFLLNAFSLSCVLFGFLVVSIFYILSTRAAGPAVWLYVQ